MTKTRNNGWRLMIGEAGNDRGHVYPTNARSLRGAQIALGRRLSGHGEHSWDRASSWGRVEQRLPDGTWGNPN